MWLKYILAHIPSVPVKIKLSSRWQNQMSCASFPFPSRGGMSKERSKRPEGLLWESWGVGNNVNPPRLQHKAQVPGRASEYLCDLSGTYVSSFVSSFFMFHLLQHFLTPVLLLVLFSLEGLPLHLCMLDSNPPQCPEPMASSAGGLHQLHRTKSISLCSAFLGHLVYASYTTTITLFTPESSRHC